MLDDLNYLKNRDSRQLLRILQDDIANLAQNSYQLQLTLDDKPQAIVVLVDCPASWIAAQLWQTTFKGIPIMIRTNCESLPDYDQRILVISILSAESKRGLQSALNTVAKSSNTLIVVTDQKEDVLSSSIEKEVHALIRLLSCSQQSKTLAFYQALLTIEQMISGSDFVHSLGSSLKVLNSYTRDWGYSSPTKKNLAKQLAYEAIGKTPLIYTESSLLAAALKWKLSFNQISRQLAWTGSWSAGNEIEFTAWSNQIFDKNYVIFYLTLSSDKHDASSFRKISRLLSGKMPAPWLIEAQGDDQLTEILWLFLLGDFVALYTAFLSNAKL